MDVNFYFQYTVRSNEIINKIIVLKDGKKKKHSLKNLVCCKKQNIYWKWRKQYGGIRKIYQIENNNINSS